MEGASTAEGSDSGHYTLSDGARSGYLDHPRQKLTFLINGKPMIAMAVGRYHLGGKTCISWRHYRAVASLGGVLVYKIIWTNSH